MAMRERKMSVIIARNEGVLERRVEGEKSGIEEKRCGQLILGKEWPVFNLRRARRRREGGF